MVKDIVLALLVRNDDYGMYVLKSFRENGKKELCHCQTLCLKLKNNYDNT